MLENNLNATANCVSGSLDQFERAIDQSIAQFGQLLHDLAAGRASSTLSAGYGHRVFEAAIPTLSSIVAARASTVDMHRQLTAIQRHQGIELVLPPTHKGNTFAAAPALQPFDAEVA